MQALIDMYP